MDYLIGILNSTLGNYLFVNSPKTGTGDLIVSVQAIEPIKVATPTQNVKNKIISIVSNIVESLARGENIDVLENELDDLVFSLYTITTEEADFIKKFVYNNYRQQS